MTDVLTQRNHIAIFYVGKIGKTKLVEGLFK